MSERKAASIPRPDALAPDQWVNYCWSDMRRRWGRQEYVVVEDYLPANYRETVQQETLVDLLYAEYLLRKEFGRSVDHEQYVARFPQLASALRRQFAVDDALSNDVLMEFGSTLTGSSDEVEAESEPIPERVGKYIVVARIGIGGQAEIYRAVHPVLGKEVVLKLARAVPGMGAADRQRVEAEAKILARIEHTNLARIYDVDFHEDRPFLVMESIRGRTLEQYARQEQPSRTQSAMLLAKVARGLAVAHRCGIAHLDIKPSNVLIDDRGEPRLIDFGLAHLADAWHEEVLEASSLRGTLYFMSPEQAQGLATAIDYRSDIFALGGLLFFLLTGAPPYPQCKFSELLRRVRACQWDQELLFHRHIPPTLRHCCLRAMDEDPSRRIPSAEAFARRLERYGRRRSHVRRVAISSLTVLLAMLAIVAISRGWVQFGKRPLPGASPGHASLNTGETNTEEVEKSHPAAAPAPDLTVEAWESERFLQLPDIAPLRTGDQVRVTATIPAGMYYGLYLLTSEGVLEQLQQGHSQGAALEMRYPDAGQAVPLVGPPGTELILVCGRRSGPVDVAEWNRTWQRDTRLPALPELSVLRVDVEGVSVLQRGRGFGTPLDLPDPETAVRERLESLHRVLRSHTDFFEAIAFSHQ